MTFCSAEPKAEYQQTEAGVIPREWRCVPIADVARLESGHTPTKRVPSYWDGAVAWVSLHDTKALDGREISSTAKTITDDGLRNSSARLLPEGTVVFSRTATVGKATVLARPMATSQDFANYICSEDLHNHFLVYLFRSMGQTWRRLMAGSIHNTIYMPTFKALKIAVPSLPEQHAIASALKDVDVLLAGLDRLIAKKSDLKQAAMQQLLTGKTRLPGFVAEWERGVEFGDIATIRNAKVVASSMPSGTPCVELDCVGQGTGRLIGSVDASGSSVKYTFKTGDVLFGRLRAYLRKYWLASFDGVCSTEIWPLIPLNPRLNSQFLHLLVQTSVFVEAAGISYGTHMPRSDWSVLRRLPVLLPSVPEQTAIAAVLSDMDAELAALDARRDKTRALKQAMMRELLTGRIRLV